MILSGHQPNYLPYPGLIGKIMMSDKFMYVTKVQFERKSWQNRNNIKTNEGATLLTVPILKKGKFDQLICDVKINNDLNWRKKHFNSIILNYKNAKFYSTYIDFFEDLYKKDWINLSELDIYIMNYIINELSIKTEILYDKDFYFEGNKTDFLVDMCKKTNCDTYISNKGSENYVEIGVFTQNSLNHKYINYIGTKYTQLHGEFINNMSIIDMLFNEGATKTKEIIGDKANYQIGKLNLKLE
ncbi:WbqC-like protein family protein [Clostridium cavendishii DSM 21758]|uniref:WbqC-like protein family protein n=1 Tax=Clostridium cavendishii DSM 21758 TaxID=1121302 RepID=A0A1M6AWS6_9CLOT|nr:WbqC family protein [Clostridium cavendishii]SHI40936.1 WbqC-like protein family protein [Clostridium cavendishii DSM 21758]